MQAETLPVRSGQDAISFRSSLAPMATVLIWAGNTIVTKAAAKVIAPESISFYRWSIAFLVLLPFAGRAAWRNRHAIAPYWPKLASLGALGMVIYQSLAYEAGRTTSAINIGLILALMPLLSALLASVFADEKLTRARVVGGIVSLAGLIYLTSQGHPSTLLTNGLHVGDGLIFIATVANSLYSVLLKRWAMPFALAQQLLWQIGFATLMLAPIWLLGTMSPITSENLPLILYAAIPTSLIAPLCWLIGIQQLGAARSAMFINLLPIPVALLAWAILGEHLQFYHYIGGGLALLGVALGLKTSGRPDVPTVRTADRAA
jgi:drug/metabolite transporter (DMT)-like permease